VKTSFRTVVGYAGSKQDIPRVTGRDLHWVLRDSGDKIIFIDARPQTEYKLFHILGTINVPADTFKLTDVQDIPMERAVYVCSGHDSEHLAVRVAEQLKTIHPRVSIVLGGPDVIRQSGFLYYREPGFDKLLEEKRLAAEAAKQKR